MALYLRNHARLQRATCLDGFGDPTPVCLPHAECFDTASRLRQLLLLPDTRIALAIDQCRSNI